MTLGTKEWADSNINCYNGCYFNCRYCYAKKMAIRFNRKTKENWSNMKLNPKALKFYKKRKGRIMFPSSHDIPDDPKIVSTCIEILKRILIPGNEVLITTKAAPNVIKRLCQELKEFRFQIQFRFTITSMNNHLLQFWEPNAPKFNDRLESLIHAKKQGYKTSVSVEPFLDHDPISLISQIYQFVTESIWIGPMSQIKAKDLTEEEKIFYKKIRENYEKSNLISIAKGLRKLDKIRFKDGFKNKLKGAGKTWIM